MHLKWMDLWLLQLGCIQSVESVCVRAHTCVCVYSTSDYRASQSRLREAEQKIPQISLLWNNVNVQNQWASERLARRGSGKKCPDPKWLKTGTGHPDSFRD